MDLVLSERIHLRRRNESVVVLLNRLRQMVHGLEVSVDIKDLTSSGWPRISMSGPDEEVSEQILKREIGVSATRSALLESNTIAKAFVDRIDTREDAIVLDIGLDPRENVRVICEASTLQAQLFDGELTPLETMVAKYCIRPGIPISIRIPAPHCQSGKIGTVLSDRQSDVFREWKEEPFERLVIQNAFMHEVETAIRQLRLSRDLADNTELSLMVCVMTFKLGTRARGLIPRLGPSLKDAQFYICSGLSQSGRDRDPH